MRQRPDMTDRAGYPLSAFSRPPGRAGTPCAETPATAGRCPLQAPAGTGPRGFTLLEVLIVIGIIGLLVAIAIPASTALVNNSRRTNTEALMKTIEGAIDAFRRDKPLNRVFPPHWFSTTQTEIAANMEKDPNPNPNHRWQEGDPIDNDDQDKRYTGTHIRNTIPGISPKSSFEPIVRTPDGTPEQVGPRVWDTTDYKCIESLYLYVTQLSPSGKQILERLPAGSVTNADLCTGGVKCPDYVVFDTNRNDNNDGNPYNAAGKDKAVDMFEIRDPWGQPLRYENTGAMGAPRGLWELRSAGPDGKFTGMLSEKDLSGDDVFMRGE